jgi:plasmid stabilization system protein ParE
MYNHIYEPQAQQEFDQSTEWYKERSLVAANNFINNVDELVELICQNPYLFKKSYKHYHEAITETYPFSIIYSIEEKIKTIVILSIYHHSRNPKKKFKSKP